MYGTTTTPKHGVSATKSATNIGLGNEPLWPQSLESDSWCVQKTVYKSGNAIQYTKNNEKEVFARQLRLRNNIMNAHGPKT